MYARPALTLVSAATCSRCELTRPCALWSITWFLASTTEFSARTVTAPLSSANSIVITNPAPSFRAYVHWLIASLLPCRRPGAHQGPDGRADRRKVHDRPCAVP